MRTRNQYACSKFPFVFCMCMVLTLAACKTAPPAVPDGLVTKYPLPDADAGKYMYYGFESTEADGIQSVYLIKSSVRQTKEIASLSLLKNIENPKDISGATMFSSIVTFQFDCKTRRQLRVSEKVSYSAPFGQGQVVKHHNYEDLGLSTWADIPKGSKAERYLQIACEQSIGVTNPSSIKNSKNSAGMTAAPFVTDRSYLLKLKEKIRANVKLPTGSEKLKTSCQARITQLPSGEIIDVKITNGSGNAEFDEAVERGIRKSSPLPVPNDRKPDRIIDITYIP